MKRLYRILDRISFQIHRGGTIIFLPILSILVTVDVVLRYVFGRPLIWAQEVSGFLILLILFLSIIHCWDKDRHVRMELLYSRLKGRLKVGANITTAIVAIFFLGPLGIAGLRNVAHCIEINESGEILGIPHWPFWLAIGVVSLFFAFKLCIYISLLISNDFNEEKPAPEKE